MQTTIIWFINWRHPFGYTIHPDLLGTLLLGTKEDKTVQTSFRLVQAKLGSTVLYELGLLNLNISYFISEKDAQAEGDDEVAALANGDTQISTSDSEIPVEEPNQ